MKRTTYFFLFAAAAILLGGDLALAEEAAKGGGSYLPIGIALTMGTAVAAGTFAQGKAVTAGLEAIGRNPSSSGNIFVPMLLGLAFIESLVVLAFVIANGMG